MRIFVVEVWHCKERPSWSDYYLIFAENEDKVEEKVKATTDCDGMHIMQEGEKVVIVQEIKQGKTTFLYDNLD